MTSHFDLAPTLLQEILGCTTAPSAYSVGTPLRQAEGRRKSGSGSTPTITTS
jgi:membrane-anchored protein YejM (alkaline phosphatase superfamily)